MRRTCFSLCLSIAVFCPAYALAADADSVYETKLKPLLRERCFSCHGALKQKANLRLDTVELMLAGGDSGAVVTRGDAAKSLVLERVSSDDVAYRMPPEGEGEPFSPEQLVLLSAWINSGAVAPPAEQPEPDPKDHWAFRSVVRPVVPIVHNDDWVRNPIDAFLSNRHEELGLTPQPEAPREILLRRLSLDLIGVPPTAQEIAAFETDASPEFYEHAVERLIGDPRYGERWGRHWMDIWRYSDWWGLGDQHRNSHPHIWHWRDWIVESLNNDLPYDEMIRQMLAADELYPNDLDKLRASGYLARNYFLFNRNQWMEETVEHVSKGFLGLTINCAKCHDHKYDPLAHADFYRMRAFFEPYHVRVDVLPGHADTSKDGIPRAFDGRPETPTYRFIRGQEKSPDESKVIEPGVPDIFDFAELNVQPVDLPPAAWQPARREWVIDAHRHQAKTKVTSAEAAVVSAREQLAAALKKQSEAKTSVKPATKPDGTAPAVHTTFETLNKQQWKRFGGDWKLTDRGLEQTKDGPTRAVLRWQEKPPRDFDASMRFTILGGSQYRSVCLAFDATQADPTIDLADAHEKLIYVSAQDAGPKLHAAILRGTTWQYPSEALVPRAIEMGRESTLRVQIRGTLVNASIDGEHLLAWRLPVERQDGAIQFTTFDAQAAFHEVKIEPLAADVVLREAGTPDPNDPASAVAIAEKSLQVAELKVAAAGAELSSLERRIAAMRAEWAKTDVPTNDANQVELDDTAIEAARSAALAEREAAAANAKANVAEAELKLAASPADKKEAVQKELATAQDAVQKAEAAIADAGEVYTKLTGAAWVATRFFNSSADDPKVEFHPQSTGRRTALANWIVDNRNPLTARVAVNHVWMRHMGEPLVPTVFDFGRKGTSPLHPELLDWLAAEFMDHGWSMKHLHRVIVNSSAYRMSSSAANADANVALDGDNKYWWRRVPIRLESQVVRDSILSLSGTLDETMGGSPVPPEQQAQSLRRSIYFFHSNNDRNLFLRTFDEALVKDCYRREQSIVPQQALALINSELVLTSAPQIAERISVNVENDNEFVQAAFVQILGIKPSETEMAASLEALEAWRAVEKSKSETGPRERLIWVLLNHNDFVTLR